MGSRAPELEPLPIWDAGTEAEAYSITPWCQPPGLSSFIGISHKFSEMVGFSRQQMLTIRVLRVKNTIDFRI